ncbi:MAG: hypothetical protein M3160_06370, partial [Candidatus Eremiobacteraeota bacterium]|nr:hypothetical protein [Candidatus Eremiobacteraeota bacterium]
MRTVYALWVLASIVTLTRAPATAGDLGKSVGGNNPPRVVMDGDTPLGPSGPQGPHGPLMIMRDGNASSSVRIGSGIASPSAINDGRSETGQLIVRGSRSTDPRSKGILFFARPTALFAKPLQTAVSAIKNDSITVETPSGEHSIRMPPGRLAAAGIAVGTKVTITADGNGATVHLRPVSAHPAPYAGIYVGAVQSAGQAYVTLRLRGGSVQTFSAHRDLSRIAGSLKGKTVALQSTDGRSARTLLTSQQLNAVLNSIPKARNHYIGRIVNTTTSAVTLDLRNGSLRTFQCTRCAEHNIASLSLRRGRAVYALTGPDAQVLNLVPIPEGTRIVGQITSANSNSLSLMLASGDVATLPCACATSLAGIGDIGPGQPIIADLDQNASITALLRYPDDGRITGTLLNMKDGRVSLLLPSGTVKSFTCKCGTGSIVKLVESAIGKRVSASLNPDAEVVSLTLGPAPATRPPTPTSRPSAPATGASARAPISPHLACTTCHDQGFTSKTIGERRPAIRSIGVQPAIGCANSNSGAIFIALRHWRSQTPVLGASVNLSGAASVTLVSPPSGYMELLDVPSGMYRVTVEKAGLRKVETADFRVNCDEGVRVQ